MMKTFGNKIFGKLTLFFTFVFCFTFVGVISTVQAVYAAGESTPTDSVYILETGKTEATKMVGGDNALLEIIDEDGTGKAVFDDTTGVLTLTNFDCQGILVVDGNTQKDIIINLVGTNTITAGYKAADFIPHGIKSQRGRITIQGDGTLNIVKGSEYYYGIYTNAGDGNDGSVTIKGNVSVSIKNAGYGIVADGNISIEGNANFSAVLEEVTSHNEDVSNGLQVANSAPNDSTITINTTGNVFIDNSVNSASSTIYPIYNRRNLDNHATITNVGKLELKYYSSKGKFTPNTFDDLKITNSMTEGSYLRRDIVDPYTVKSYSSIVSKTAENTIYTVKVSDGTTEIVDGVRQQKWNTYQYIEGETAIAFADIKIAGNVPFYGWLVYEGTTELTPFDSDQRVAEFTVDDNVSIVAMYNGFTGTPAFTQDAGATTGKITGWTKLIENAQVLVVPVDDNGIPQWNTSYDYCCPTYISNSNYVGLTTETQTNISTLPAGKYRLAYSHGNLSTDRHAYSDVFDVSYTLTSIDKPTSSSLTYNGSEQQGIAENEAYTISGTYKATNANTYTATVTLKDGYEWSDGTTDKTISVDWTINKKSIDIPTAKTGLVYNETPQQGVEAGEGYTFVREHIQTNAGGYEAVVSLTNNNYIWKDNTTEDKEIYWEIARKPIDKPTANTGLVYTGGYLYGVTEDSSRYTLTNHKQYDPGDYIAKATPTLNYMWVGGGTETIDIPWSIAKKEQSAPTHVKGSACTNSGNNDGRLVAVNEYMEYRLKGASTWISVPNGASYIYNLAAGTYEVRYEELAYYYASPIVEVVINEYNHVCGSLTKTDKVEATHFTEGKEAYWTCSCGKHYEDENGTKPINNINTWGIIATTNHELSENWTFDETHHWKDCTIEGCENKDSYEIHKGGAATCTEQAICEVCGQKYGDLTAHNYNNEWSSNETNHWKECTCGDKKNNEEHTFGEWTTVKEATETEVGSKERVCTICNHKQTEEIAKLPHAHSYSTDWKFDVTSHYKDCACGEKKEVANHDYTDDIDDTCNTCGFKRTINNPTPTPTPDPIEKDGLSGGAIAGIVVTSVVVLSLGGFSVFWFVIKKKSFKDLIKIFKK